MSKNNSFAARFGKKPVSDDVPTKEDVELKPEYQIIEDSNGVIDVDYDDSDEDDLLSSKDDKSSDVVKEDDNAKSFTDRFAKKSTFTAERSSDKKVESKKVDISNVDPKKRAQADLIYLVKGIDDNRNAWYYVLVERPKVQLFLKALNDDIIHLENYGIILFSAYGDEPSQDITDAVNKEYGIR